jgi:hypothetical protein
MSSLVKTDDLIKDAKRAGVDFGKGDPYNRLRYYTKIGWLPHMTRKKTRDGDVVGHYPKWVLDRLIQIDKLKDQGYTNDQISDKINTRNKLQNLYAKFNTDEFRNRLVIYIALLVLVVVLINELDLANISKSKNQVISSYTEEVPTEIIASGTAFVPAGKNKVFVKNTQVNSASKVYVTFNENFTPATRFWVSNIEPQEGFYLELDAPVLDNTEFSWWLSQ